MTKGTTSFGKKHNKTHTLCRRCGRSSYHIQKKVCAMCGYPAKRKRTYQVNGNWPWGCKRILEAVSLRFQLSLSVAFLPFSFDGLRLYLVLSFECIHSQLCWSVVGEVASSSHYRNWPSSPLEGGQPPFPQRIPRRYSAQTQAERRRRSFHRRRH